MDKSERIVSAIVADLTDRSGLQNEWEAIDEDVRKEIKDTWLKIVRRELAKED